jgi:hypothetical protein
MTISEEQLEWVVQEVLRRLGAGVAVDREANHAQQLSVTDRLITMRSIEGRLNGVTQIVVRRRAIITPAVRDELKQRKIELIEAPE